MGTPILLIGHCHTGSRFLTKLFNKAGMELGNEKCGWVDCVSGQEHPDLSRIGNTLYREIAGIVPHTPKIERLSLLRKVLEDYRTQADLNKWYVFGVKNNYFIDPTVWGIVSNILLDVWNDVKIVITVRHPIDVNKSINLPDWTLDASVDAFRRTFEITKQLVETGKAKLMIYPDSFENDDNMKEIVEWTGLEWKDELAVEFDSKSITNRVTKEERIEFAKKYTDAEQEFVDLCYMAKKKEIKTFGSSVVLPKKKVTKGKKNGKS